MPTDPAHRDPHADQLSPASEVIPVVLRFLRVLRRRQHVLHNALLVCGLLGVVYYATATRLYQSTAKLLIIQQKQDEIATVGNHDSSDNTMLTQRETLLSPVVLEAAVKRLSPSDRVDLVDKPPENWTKTLAAGLSASVTRRTNFIDVSYRSKHPAAAAAVVRSVVDAYLEFVRENHKGTAAELKAVLTEERTQLEATLAKEQAELQRLREELGHLALPTDEGVVEPIVQRALKLNEAMMAAQQRRVELQSTLTSIEGAIARGEDVNQHLVGVEQSVGEQMMLMTLGMSPQDMTVLADQEKKLLAAQDRLQELSPFLGPNHPQVTELQQQIVNLDAYLRDYRTNLGNRFDAKENAQLGGLVRDMLAQAVAQSQERERQLAASFEQARSEAAQHSGKIEQLHMLERKIERINQYNDVIFDKLTSLDLRQIQAPIQVTVAREPRPEARPVSPQLRVVVLVCLFMGTVIGCAVVYVQDVLDDRFDSPEELAAQLSAPVMAIIRDLEPLAETGMPGVHAFAAPNTAATEAFRTLRTSILLNPAAANRILISSSEPGDGKTTVAINLAVAFAQAGKRTLIIDADLRKPGLTTRLAMKSNSGLTDFLLAEGSIEQGVADCVVQSDQPGLHVLATGRRRPNPAELLGNGRFAELLAWAESNYDQVLVDCPPVLAVSDAHVIGRWVDGALLVVRPEKNHRRSVVRAVESLHAAGCELLGVVANGVTAAQDGYGYGYGYGYGHEDEHAEPAGPETTAPQGFHSQNPVSIAFQPTPPTNVVGEPDVPIRPRRAA